MLLLDDLGSREDFVACVVPQPEVDDILAAHGAVGVCKYDSQRLTNDLRMEKNVQERVQPATCKTPAVLYPSLSRDASVASSSGPVCILSIVSS